MRNKSLFLLVACVCGTIAAIGVSQWMQAQDQTNIRATYNVDDSKIALQGFSPVSYIELGLAQQGVI